MINYFSYGSNMLNRRMTDRCPSAELLEIAQCQDMHVVFHKPSIRKNGMKSGKAAITVCPGESVFGVLYRLPKDEFLDLCSIEKGYMHGLIKVTGKSGVKYSASVHVAETLDKSLTPYDWYAGLVVAGAVENRLPKKYVMGLKSIQVVPDPGRDYYKDALEACEILESL